MPIKRQFNRHNMVMPTPAASTRQPLYAARKKISLEEAQRWLAPNLGYDADGDSSADVA